MRQDSERTRTFTRRALVVGGIQAALFGALGVRLWHLQVDEGQEYSLLAEDNRVNQRLLIPPRGRILDSQGRALARNIPTYRVRLVREQTRDPRATLQALARLVALDAERIEAVLAQLATSRRFVPVTVRDDLSWEEVSSVAVRSPELPGVLLDSALFRDYPQGEVTAHIVGYLGPPTVTEQAADPDPLLTLPEFRMGKSGVEKSHDAALRGRAGLSRVEVNVVGREIRELDRSEGIAGRDVALSLDLDLQRYCFERLSGELAASTVVVEVATGAVRAMASVPSYDPAVFQNGLSPTIWKELRDNPRTPLVNKCIRGQYPPGSTFKMVTALAALQAGIAPGAKVFCSGATTLGKAVFHCWKQGGHGAMDMIHAIEQSCDCFFYDVARRIGVDAIAETARRLGLGGPLGIDLPGEMPGLIPTRAWKKARLDQQWHQGETLVNAIGQGFVLATPLQLAVMTARLCNGGRAVTPWFVAPDADPAAVPPTGIPEAHLAIVRDGMHAVVHGSRGTARQATLGLPGIEMAGKTGTSQVKRISKADRLSGRHKRKDRPWKERDHALFVCFAPVAAPRYAVSVIVEHGEGGSATAAPIARDIMRRALDLDLPDSDLRAALVPPASG
ncbi:MAG: penicillin-binding protein 2 [Geminicoccaceae bacterium]